MYYQDHNEEHIFPYCAYELFNPKAIANIHFGVTAIQLFSFVIFILLCAHNNKKLVSYIEFELFSRDCKFKKCILLSY